MEVGVFIPIGNNGWLISQHLAAIQAEHSSSTAEVVLNAERYGLEFVLSMIKLRGFGGPTEFWDHNLELFTLMAGLAAVTSRIRLYATVPTLAIPPAIAARMAVDHRLDLRRAVRAQRHHRLAATGIRPDGPLAGRRVFRPALRLRCRIRADPARPVEHRRLRLPRRVLSDERLPSEPPPAGRHEADLRRPERGRDGVHRRLRRLQFLLRQRLEHADRVRRHHCADADRGREDRAVRRVATPSS